MAKNIQAIRGMHDTLPQQTPLWQYLERQICRVLQQYAYEEIRTPIVEMTELFKRSIGEVTDIVEKEMYTFKDRNGDSLTLRPEGTAACVRACMEGGLLHNQTQRLWYQGPMFRHERPQKGRYRQFQQIGVETFGLNGPDIDLELILITQRIWKAIGLDGLELQLNTLGTLEERTAYREVLVSYFRQHLDQLDEDSLRRLESNPLRILDSKNPDLKELNENAPSLMDYLGADSKEHFETLCQGLDAADISYVINPRLVRGLDYYSLTVFEWVTTQLGAQGTICAGGRFNGLVKQLGGRETPAIGFAMGLERLIMLLEARIDSESLRVIDLYLVMMGKAAQRYGMVLAETLRDELPECRLQVNCGDGSLKSQFKKADKSGARYALVLGDDELEQGVISLKPLRGQGEQQTVELDKLAGLLKNEVLV